MQALLPKWKNAFIFNKIVVQSSTIIPNFADFHSTAPTLGNKSSKNNSRTIKFAIRQRRADSKRALKDVLFGKGYTDFAYEPLPRMKERLKEFEDRYSEDHFGKKQRSKAASARREAKAKRAKRLQKERKEKNHEQFDDNPNVFRATFGNRSYTWAFRSDDVPPFQRSTTDFEWTEKSRWYKKKLNESDYESESDEESSFVGKDSDRLILGLPAKSPLKIDDVKNAFRLSALKWHPDRHQGPTQASAEEKFKRCVDAYKSLCDALSTA